MNQEAGHRLLGFPLSDEQYSQDHRCRVSRFEWGSIYWIFGGIVVYGKIREMYGWGGSESGFLGYPVTDRLQ